MRLRVAAIALAVVVLAGCATATPTPTSKDTPATTPTSAPVTSAPSSLPSAECERAFADVSIGLDAHYAKWVEVDPDDFDLEEAEFLATIDPIYDACSSAADFLAAGKVFPEVFGLRAAQFVDAATISIYCYGHELRSSCDGVGDLT